MTTAVEQYRALVAKLEAINPSESPAPLSVPVNLEKSFNEAEQSAMNVASGNIPQPNDIPQAGETPAIASNQIPTLTGTFKQAYAQAVKQGLKQFQWCGTYSTRRGQGAKPAEPDTLPTTRTYQPQYDVKNDASGRAQAGLGNLI